MMLSSEHRALFSLLRAGLWEREPDDLSPFPLTDAGWWNVYRMAVRQTVAGIVYRGLHHLPDTLLPGDGLMIRWVAHAERIEQKNKRMNVVVNRLYRRMDRYGLHPVLLKGRGQLLSMNIRCCASAGISTFTSPRKRRYGRPQK